jgi:hypothetical protein
MRRQLALLAAGLAAVLASPALARPCTASEVAGLWELISIKADEPGVQAFYEQAPHEYLRINPAMGFAYVASRRKLPADDADEVISAAAASSGAPLTVQLPRPGQLFVMRNGTEPFQGFSCAIADVASDGAAKGDMIWTELPEPRSSGAFSGGSGRLKPRRSFY